MTQLWSARAGGAGRARRPARTPSTRRRTGLGLTLVAVLATGACASPAQDPPDRASLAGSATVERTPDAPAARSQISPEPSGGPTPVAGKPWDAAVTAACEAALTAEHLDDLAQVAQAADERGMASFWAHDRQWAMCDVTPDSAPAVHPGVGAAGFDRSTLRIDATAVGADQAVRYTAGGLLPWPVDEIAYTFPDGHTQKARFVRSEASEDVWWAVAYTATEGPLADPGADPDTLDPVTISVVGAAAESMRLPWRALQRSE
jgi:hypothetical protein